MDDRGRRTWDKAAYERKAKYGHAGTVATDLKSDKRNLPPSKRDMLTARDYKVDLDSKVNRTSVVSMTDGGKVKSLAVHWLQKPSIPRRRVETNFSRMDQRATTVKFVTASSKIL